MSVKKYDPNKVTIVFGPVIIGGFQDGTFVSVDFNEDAYTLQIGVDGEGCRSRSNNDSATIIFTLGQWSETNDELSIIHNTDKLTGFGIYPLMIKDENGTTLYAAETAWIRKFPMSDFDREAVSREWALETDKLNAFIGGSI